ncbi:MAG TPA: hypothetical protein VNN77_06775, partial [candidate division Zixibacteria bacterium]|nr:hypothetical protein [candidate division Zixibacteria bacterium]
VALQPGMVKALEDTLKRKINLPPQPHMVGALGAALLGINRLKKRREETSQVAAAAEPARALAASR